MARQPSCIELTRLRALCAYGNFTYLNMHILSSNLAVPRGPCEDNFSCKCIRAWVFLPGPYALRIHLFQTLNVNMCQTCRQLDGPAKGSST